MQEEEITTRAVVRTFWKAPLLMGMLCFAQVAITEGKGISLVLGLVAALYAIAKIWGCVYVATVMELIHEDRQKYR